MHRRLALLAALVLAAASVSASPPARAATSSVGSWTPSSNSLSVLRYSFRATTLASGLVLVEGGFAPGSYTTQAEIYDPATNAWSVIAPMHNGRGEHTATLLASGRVLVAGGYAGPVLAAAEVYDPTIGQWQTTSPMGTNRTRHAAVRLADGRVLVSGGWNGSHLSSAEVYDPASGTWSRTGSMVYGPRTNHLAILLDDGTVLIAGGSSGGTGMASAEVFAPSSGTFTATASMQSLRGSISGVKLPDGRVLVLGGGDATAEIYDPATRTWAATAPSADPHSLGMGEDVQLLPDGRVLVPGDATNGLSAELFDPASNSWSFTADQNAVHYGGVTALLADGRVLNAGGMDAARNLTSVGEVFTTGVQDDFAYPVNPASAAWANGYDGNTQLSKISACYGVALNQTWHAGQDYGFPSSPVGKDWTNSTDVKAVGAGVVRYSSKPGSGGTTTYEGGVIIIEHSLGSGTVYSMYAHLDPAKILVATGANVVKGQVIANGLIPQVTVNRKTGVVFDNTHLHWEMRYFFDGSAIKKPTRYTVSCSGIPGPGYTYPGHPDDFSAVVGKQKDGTLIYATYRWTNPAAFIDTH